MINVFQAAHAAWHDPDVDEKLSMAMVLYGYWEGGVLDMSDAQTSATHLLPGRPDKPPLVAPHDIGKRSTYTKEGRAALIHAIAHIEFNAVNLALDAVWRFRSMPAEYYRDWLKVAADEAQTLLCCAPTCVRLVLTTGILPRMTDCGMWPAVPLMMFWRAWL